MSRYRIQEPEINMNHENTENWIWLPDEKYPHDQISKFSANDVVTISQHEKAIQNGRFSVVQFKRNYTFDKKVTSAQLRFSGDTTFVLYCNGAFLATGPAAVGGDFLTNDTAREEYYSFKKVICPNSYSLEFFASVQLTPTRICDYSKGHGGFMLFGLLTFEDGSTQTVSTDETWLARRHNSYTDAQSYNGLLPPDDYIPSKTVPNIWNTFTAPIPPREENEIFPSNCTLTVEAHESLTAELELDMIYAGFLHVTTQHTGVLEAEISLIETQGIHHSEKLFFKDSTDYRSFHLDSAGIIHAKLTNPSDVPATVTISFITTCYPVNGQGATVTSDSELNSILEVCKHTLKYCRQTLHLDSPRHCEPLACTGDYYIESLMTLFSFGDMRLAEFDVIRTANTLMRQDGRMFHTTYSLIWVRMLYDTYMATGNEQLLVYCEKALELLLKRFESYIGENGLIETPPDYMFIDWIYIDGISMHHPPKALGQTCLNMFYYGALDSAAKIYAVLGKNTLEKAVILKKNSLKSAINSLLFDREKQIYFEGLNTPTSEELLGEWMPQNVQKRYYLKQSNTLAAFFGICDSNTARNIIEKIMNNEIEGELQPYFTHYLLEAVFSNGLREKYTLKIIEKWKAPIRDCQKGLVEGFIAPEPTYSFDHSHAWGGTPLYSLPKALLGLEIAEAGMKKINLSPTTLGLSHAKTELLTPFGKVICSIKATGETDICAPDEIEINILPLKN